MDLLQKFYLFVFLIYAGAAEATLTYTGTWEYRGSGESGLWLVTEQKGNVVKFQLEISRGAPSYNSGWIEGEFLLKGNKGTFRSDNNGPCEISFSFTQHSAQLNQPDKKRECGFGAFVYAQGALRLKNRKTPKFCNSDPRSGGCDDVSP